MQIAKVYIFLILFVVSWWAFAFKKSPLDAPLINHPTATTPLITRSLLDPAIISIDRDLLRQALAGDFSLMARLIVDWDIDAQILDSQGFQEIKRIHRADFLHSQSLIRILQNKEALQKSTAIFHQLNPFVVDDKGSRINWDQKYKRFLPQTYTAASFLLSLVPAGQIVALPRSLREQTALYPQSLTNQIPLDIDRYNTEKLFLANPQIAFVARYSHPSTIQALTNQGITLYTMRNLSTLADISQELVHIGNITNKPLQAELMKIFIDAAICAIDNQQRVLIRHFEERNLDLPKILFVNYHQTFSVPTSKTLTGHILSRMQLLDISLKYSLENDHANEWMVPIDKERLLNLNPDILIITTENEQAIGHKIRTDKALQKLSAIRHNRLLFVDESIQHSPSQYAVLAYHDLIQALMNSL